MRTKLENAKDLRLALNGYDPVAALQILEREPSLVSLARHVVDDLERDFTEHGLQISQPGFDLAMAKFQPVLEFRRQLTAWEARRAAFSAIEDGCLNVSTGGQIRY